MADFPVIAIGASIGGLDAVRCIIEALPRNCGAAVCLVMQGDAHPSQLPEILMWHGKVPAAFPRDGEPLAVGHVYVAPPDHHMILARGRIQLDRGAPVHGARPAVDPLFVSAALNYGNRVVGVVLSGRSQDGASGLRLIRKHGGLVLVQDPAEATTPERPAAAAAEDHPDVLPIAQLARRVAQFCAHPLGRQAAEQGESRTGDPSLDRPPFGS